MNYPLGENLQILLASAFGAITWPYLVFFAMIVELSSNRVPVVIALGVSGILVCLLWLAIILVSLKIRSIAGKRFSKACATYLSLLPVAVMLILGVLFVTAY